MEVIVLVLALGCLSVLVYVLIQSRAKKKAKKKQQAAKRKPGAIAGGAESLNSYQKDLEEAEILQRQIEQIYDLQHQLGTGATSIVLYAEHRATQVGFAAKIVNTHLRKEDYKLVQNEIKIMKSLDHPNIIQLKEIFISKRSSCLILELASGGELLERISRMEFYNEKVASRILSQLLSALNYLHSLNILHLDLKPRNILFQTLDDDSPIKLSDFGLSSTVADMKANWDYIVGTPEYIAPEVITGGVEFGAPVDIWSAGIILYIMLFGSSPFCGTSTEHTFKLIVNEDITFPHYITSAARQLIIKMLQKDPSNRITAQTAMESYWIMDVEGLPSTPLPFVRQKMRNFNARVKLRMGITAVIATNRFLSRVKKRRVLMRDLSTNSLNVINNMRKKRVSSSLEPSSSKGLLPAPLKAKRNSFDPKKYDLKKEKEKTP